MLSLADLLLYIGAGGIAAFIFTNFRVFRSGGALGFLGNGLLLLAIPFITIYIWDTLSKNDDTWLPSAIYMFVFVAILALKADD